MGRQPEPLGYLAKQQVEEIVATNVDLVRLIIAHKRSNDPLDYEVFIRTQILPMVLAGQNYGRELLDIYAKAGSVRSSEKT